MAGRDDGAALGDAAFERFALLLRLAEGSGEVYVTRLVAAEVDFEIGDVATGAGHLAFGD